MFNFNKEKFDFSSNLNKKDKDSLLEVFNSKEVPDLAKFLNKKSTKEEIFKRYNVHKEEHLVITDIFNIIDENFKFTSYQELLNVAFFVGSQVDTIFSNIKKDLYMEKGGSRLEELLAQAIGKSLGMDAKVINMNDFMNNRNKNEKSNYTYELTTKLHIIDKATENELTVTNNIENIINEIITKEGYNNIKDKRIFATGTDSIVSEVLPKYENNKCVSVQFEVLN